MRKWTALLMALAMVLLLVTGCGEASPEQEAAKVVAEVNGTKVTKGEAQEVYDFMTNQYVMMSAQNGETLDITNEGVISTIKAETLTIVTETIALDQKLEALGHPLTDEDRAGFKEEAQAEYDLMAQSYIDYYGVTREEADGTLDGMGYSLFAIEYMIYRSEVMERLRPLADLNVLITEEDIQTKYDALVAESTETYATSPTQFVNDFLEGTTIYYRPEGFRLVKNLVIGFSDETQAKIDEKDSEGYAYGMEQYYALLELYTTTDISDERQAELETLMADLDVEMQRVEEELVAIIAEGHEAEKERAEEILALAQAEGADFDALMAEYSVDTATGIPLEQGYPVATDISTYVAEFTEGAMALAQVGDVSGLVASDYGYHIIKYVGDIAPGAVPLDEVHDTVEALLLSESETTAFDEKMNEWLDDAKITTYLNRF